MAESDKQVFQQVLTKYVDANPSALLNEVSKEINQLLRTLAESGKLSLGQDKDLTGESLEIRVFLLLQSAGFTINRGRLGFEDFIIQPPERAVISWPLVLEVKSDRKPSVQRDHLRQLDDWVFDLSQEEFARKKGLGGGLDSLAIATSGFILKTHHHPTPHKGVLIFNGPVGKPFEERVSNLLSPDELNFSAKRNFCIIPFKTLIDIVVHINSGHLLKNDFWKQVHETQGEYPAL